MPAFKITLLNQEKGQFEDIFLPGKYEVCQRCLGGGSQDVYDGGMTGAELYEAGQDFIDDYREGVYSKPCEECGGKRVVAVADRSKLTKKQTEQLDHYELITEQYYKELAAEAQYAGYF